MTSSGARILLLEQHRPSATLLRLLFTSRGHSCEVVETTEQAFTRMVQLKPHVIVYEWFVPGGREFARAARSLAAKDSRRIGIVALSTQDEPAHFRDAEGVDEYIVKPYKPEQLDRVIDAFVKLPPKH